MQKALKTGLFAYGKDSGMKANPFRDRMIAAARENKRDERALKRRIIRLYEQAAEDMAAKAAASKSGSLTERFALDLSRDLRGRIRQLWEEIGDSTRDGMLKHAQRASAVQTSFLDEAGKLLEPGLHLKLQAAFGKVPEGAVAHVLRGGIYGGQAPSLSKRIWNNAALQSGKIEDIIAQAVAKGESPIKLARALEAYVRPDATEPDAWNDIYDIPFDYKIDYNAKRLAVTSVRHAAWGATISAGMKNPYADFLHWELTPAHVIFDVCDGYAEHEEGLGPGNWPLESAPLPHPWCTCLYYVDTNESLDEIARELNTWARGERSDARLDALFGEWEKENRLVKFGKDDIIKSPDIYIDRGVGARHKDEFDIIGPDGETNAYIPKGEYIRDVVVFAGKGTRVRIREDYQLEEFYKVPAAEWQKVKGKARVIYQGEEHLAEIHWYQSDATGRVEGKIKSQKGGWWLDDR